MLARLGTHTHPLPHARYEQHTLQPIPNVTDTKLKLDTAVTTDAAVTPSGTGNTDFTFGRAGRLLVTASARFAAGAGGEGYMTIVVAGDRKTAASTVASSGFAIAIASRPWPRSTWGTPRRCSSSTPTGPV